MSDRVDTAEGRRLLDNHRLACEVGEPYQVSACWSALNAWWEENSDALLAAAEERDTLRAEVDAYRPLIAALAIYGDGASLPALVEKARSFFNEGGESIFAAGDSA